MDYESSSSATDSEPSASTESEEPKTETDENTAMLPSGLFASAPKKGDVVSMRVVNVYDGEVELALAESPGRESAGGSSMTADAELDSMAQE